MILDFIRSLIGDFFVLVAMCTGVAFVGLAAYLFTLMELERRREKKRIAEGKLSEFEIGILSAFRRL